MAEEIDGLCLSIDKEGDKKREGNPFFSPAGFASLKAWIHLIPLWSQCVPTMVLLAGFNVPSTNGQIESYFKSLK